MQSIQQDVDNFKKQLEQGSTQKAYRALIAFMMGLRTRFSNEYGDSAVSALYQGYLDMTYFAVFPAPLKQHDLKIAIVFNYNDFRFEAWLAARNRKVQRKYREIFKDTHWSDYRVVAPAEGIDSIIECDLAKDFDINDVDGLSSKIESLTKKFIIDIEKFLEQNKTQAA